MEKVIYNPIYNDEYEDIITYLTLGKIYDVEYYIPETGINNEGVYITNDKGSEQYYPTSIMINGNTIKLFEDGTEAYRNLIIDEMLS